MNRLIIFLLSLCLCQNAFADFNPGDVFGKGFVVEASGTVVTGGGRVLNFLTPTISTANNVFNIPVGSGGGGSTSPAGSNTDVQYNSLGSFGANGGFIYNGSNIGISSANPGQVLDVQGTIRTTNLSVPSTGLTIDATTATGLTGTGKVMFATSPTITNTLTVVTVRGGTGNTSTFNLSNTSNASPIAASFGEWDNTSGTGKITGIHLDNNSNVGIGSVNPGTTLDVTGTLRTTAFNLPTGSNNNYVLTSDSSGNGTWQPSSGGSGSNYWNLAVANVGIDTIYNVGIGSVSPTQALDVNGTVRMSSGNITGFGNLYFGNDGNSNLQASKTTNADLIVNTNTSISTVIQTFTSSGTFTPTFTGNVHVLIVAGGGGGGSNAAGGGGGGQVIDDATYPVVNGTPITVTVGGGGAGGINTGSGGPGTVGSNSVFGTMTAAGGGYGGGEFASGICNGTCIGGNGYNGGGGSGPSAGGTGTNFNGCTGTAPGPGTDGGGGSGDTSACSGVTGGQGYTSNISGVSIVYGSGGGAGANGTLTAGTGGTGAGNGSYFNGSSCTSVPNASTPGSGGGGSGASNSPGCTGGNGSAGEVIVSFVPGQATETARFTTGGNLGINSMAPGQALDVQGSIRSTAVYSNGWSVNYQGEIFYTEGTSADRGYMTSGTQEPGGGLSTCYPYLLSQSVWGKNSAIYYNDAVDGTTTTQMLARYTTGNSTYGVTVPSAHSVSPAVTGSNVRALYFLSASGVRNDVENSVNTATSISNLQSLVADAQADGYFVIVLTNFIVVANPISATATAQIEAVNQAIRNGTIPSNMIVDTTNWMPNQFDFTYWNTDWTHPTNQGHIVLASNLIQAMIAGGNQVNYAGNYNLTSNAGNVGIGTILTPVNYLDVAGGVSIGTTYAGLTLAPSNGLIVQGNVGINSAAPGQNLDVNGSIRATNIGIGTYAVCSTSGNCPSGGGGSQTPWTSTINGAGNQLVNTGNIGIGSLTPGQAEDINGTLRVFGNVGIGTPNPGDQLDVNGSVRILGTPSLSIGTTNTTNYLNVGTLAQFNVSSAGSIATANITAVGNISTTGTVLSTGTNPTFGSAAAATATVSFEGGQGATSKAIIQSTSKATADTTDAIQFKLGNAGVLQVMTMQDNSGIGNVGIGSIAPNSALDIESTVSPIVFMGAIPATGTNQNVGIGSWTPGTMLDIQGTERDIGLIATNNISVGTSQAITGISGTGPLILSSTAFTATGTERFTGTIAGSTGTNGNLNLAATTSNNPVAGSGIIFENTTGTGQKQSILDNNGNLGIGSLTPGTTLDVAGTVRFSNSLINTKSTTGIGWSEHNATNQACNTTCGTSACVIGLDIGTVGVVNSGFVACTDATADDCICAGP